MKYADSEPLLLQEIKLTLEQRRFELHGFTYIQTFFSKYIGKDF